MPPPPAIAIATAVARGAVVWANWADLISFRPSAAVQSAVKSRASSWYIHKIENAYGDLNIDLYPVNVSVLPKGLTAESLLEYLRTNINDFLYSGYARFQPYDDKYPPAASPGDKARWLSSSPTPAVLSIQMRTPVPWEYHLNPDDGSVICAEKTTNYWIFSTLRTDQDKEHPVSGNRQFGFIQGENGYVFFTRGADRATGYWDNFPLTPVFTMADLLWKSFQDRLARYVNDYGGSATTANPISVRVDWGAAKLVAWHPTEPWL
jgi:hypothetical protein